jgi:hypothetical protein
MSSIFKNVERAKRDWGRITNATIPSRTQMMQTCWRTRRKCNHPAISTFIADWQAELISTGQSPSPLEQAAIDLENEWSQKYVTGALEVPTDPPPSPVQVLWELDPPPLLAHQPPRITDSNTRITQREGSVKEPLPKSESGLGWVQIQQKSLRWEEHIQGSPIITYKGLTTVAHPNRGWTIASGTWHTLRAKWGLISETLQRIYDSSITQRQLETAHTFTPTRHIFQTIKRIWQVEGIHGLPAIAVPTFFSTASRNKETWWEESTGKLTNVKAPQDEQSADDSGETKYAWDSSDEQEEGDTKTTAYMWDSMDEEDRTDIMDNLDQSDKWVIWKSKDKWSVSLKDADFHQLLHIHQDIQDECWGLKITGWHSKHLIITSERMSTWLTWQDMKRITGREQNRAS